MGPLGWTLRLVWALAPLCLVFSSYAAQSNHLALVGKVMPRFWIKVKPWYLREGRTLFEIDNRIQSETAYEVILESPGQNSPSWEIESDSMPARYIPPKFTSRENRKFVLRPKLDAKARKQGWVQLSIRSQ